MTTVNYISNLGICICIIAITIINTSCEKFVQAPPPKTDLVKTTVFKEQGTATAAMLSVYGLMTTSGFSSGNTGSITFLSGLSSDEFELYNSNQDLTQFFTSSLIPTNSNISILWSSLYSTIYRTNSILEGIKGATSLPVDFKNQLEGESRFIRAFSYFYLTNLFGGVPLSVTTDYEVNRVLAKASIDSVYALIIDDLLIARELLPADYSVSSGERVRVNKYAASALLARVYLYLKQYDKAEIEASKVIEMTTLFKLSAVMDVFLKNSTETIWQLNNNAYNTNEAGIFIFTGKPRNASLNESLYHSFEANDLRKENWVQAKTSAGITYYQISKYKAARIPPVTNPVTLPVEYTMVLRLTEQYLIRAEARVYLGKLTGVNSAQADIDSLRNRAGLLGTTATTSEELLLAVEKERMFEFFGEWGQRWFDLKRTGQADVLLKDVKGSNWQTEDQLYPIPQEQILNNPSMNKSQNPGYNS